jgi:putative peptidoglycan lipid II flippase
MALLRSVATVGGYTLISRVLGFLREMLTATFLGAGPISDAFFVALRLPNMFRSLFAEGAFSAAFVPIFAGMIAKEGRAAALRFAEDVLAALLTALLVFLILGELGAPWILRVIAPGFESVPGKFALAVALTRIMFPYLLCISLVAFLGGMLNSVERFAATAATPTLLNIFLIAALVFVRPVNGEALAWAVTAAGGAQFLWLMVSCRQAGLSLSLPRPRLTPAVRKLLRVMLPGVFGSGIVQVNLLVSTAIASLLPTGAVSYLSYADRLNQLPLALVGIAVGTAILPPLSRQVRTGDEKGAVATQNRGLELALLLTLPAAIALAVSSHPILAAVYQHGAFGAEQTRQTAPALTAYALGLPAFVLIKVMAPGFFARHDMATPVKIAALAMAANIVLTIVLGVGLMRSHVGIAYATTIAGWINALSLILMLQRRGYFALDAKARRSLPRILLAALGMGGLLLVLEMVLAPLLAGRLVLQLAGVALLVFGGLAGFGLLALLFGVAEPGQLKRLLRRQAA